MIPRYMRSSQKKRLVSQLGEKYGIKKIPHLLIDNKSIINGFTGTLSKDELNSLASSANLISLGIPLIKKEDLELTLEGIQTLKEQVSKSILELPEEHLNKWLHALDIPIKKEQGQFIIKYQEDFLGAGVSTGEKIKNQFPKERRLKTPLS